MAYFDKYGVEFSDDRKTLVKCPKDFQGEYVIPNGVISINEQAFYDCLGLKSIIISNDVIYIGDEAFFHCIGLTSVSIGNSVTHIGCGAFCDCTNLSVVKIGSSVKYIGSVAFYDCSNLMSIALPNSVTIIEPFACEGCISLKKIYVPQGQKDRFTQMKGLKNIKEKIVEVTSNSQKLRTWEEVNSEYRAYFERRQKENPNIQNKNGGTPLEFPPFGIELSFQEYSQFKKDGHTIPFWMFWCKSGNEIHELARLYAPVNSIGLSTPRQGYYKIVGIEGEGNETMLVCYYNLFSSDEFLEEEDEKVRVKQKPLFNKHSSCAGPIDVGDVIHVKSTELVEDTYNGRTYQAYKIIWEFV